MSIDQELKQKLIAKLQTGVPLDERECSLCGYMMSWYCVGPQLYYDSGCDCTTYKNRQPRDWSSLDFNLEPEHGHIPRLTAYVEGK